jgi:hypothetical protein
MTKKPRAQRKVRPKLPAAGGSYRREAGGGLKPASAAAVPADAAATTAPAPKSKKEG